MTASDEVGMAGPRLAIRVAELLRLAHSQSGLSQREMAEALGVGEARVSQILNGDGNLHIATVARAFAAMGCHAELKVFDSAQEEVRIEPRRPRRKSTDVTYVHPVAAADGRVRNVYSWSFTRVEGSPVDFPMQAEMRGVIGTDFHKGGVDRERSEKAHASRVASELVDA